MLGLIALLLAGWPSQPQPNPRGPQQVTPRPRLSRTEGRYDRSSSVVNWYYQYTNYVLFSQQLDNAAWSKSAFGGASAPTVTANQATAPDGTLTADRVQFAATTAGQQSIVNQNSPLPITSGPGVACVYVMGNGTSGTLDVGIRPFAETTFCNYVSGAWTLCYATPVVVSSAHAFNIGNDTFYSGVARGAQDVFLWQADAQDRTSCAPYIVTTAAAASRTQGFY